MTAEDQAATAYEILLDGKHCIGRAVSHSAAEALRWARGQWPTMGKRLTVRVEGTGVAA